MPPGSSGGLAFALVHFGDPGTTLRCLESLASHAPEDCRVFIADHGPGPGLTERLATLSCGPRCRVIGLDNPGFGAGCNAAAEAAFAEGARWVWFLNNDATLEGPVATQLMVLADAHPEVGLWGTRQLDGNRRIDADRLPSWFPTPSFASPELSGLPEGCRQLGPRETLSGASILISRDAWTRLGPWPEWCFLYWEDVAWCLAAHRAGIPVVMTGLEVVHPRNSTTGHHSATSTYYGVRNVLLLHGDLWPGHRRQRLAQAVHLLQKRFFQGRWRMLGPTLSGIVDAWRGARFRRG